MSFGTSMREKGWGAFWSWRMSVSHVTFGGNVQASKYEKFKFDNFQKLYSKQSYIYFKQRSIHYLRYVALRKVWSRVDAPFLTLDINFNNDFQRPKNKVQRPKSNYNTFKTNLKVRDSEQAAHHQAARILVRSRAISNAKFAAWFFFENFGPKSDPDDRAQSQTPQHADARHSC